MYCGNGPAGGGAELPGSPLQTAPHVGLAGVSAKPLKLRAERGAFEMLSAVHRELQKVTACPIAACPAPMAKAPPPGANENPIVVQDLLATLPPSSRIDVLMVNWPSDE